MLNIRTLIAVILLISASFNASAQFTVSGIGAAPDGNYTSLTNTGGVFEALNAASNLSGKTVIVTVTASSTSEAGTVALNQNASPWTSLRIVPVAGAWEISGSVNGPLINLNGADYVTIDGVNSGGLSLTIDNTFSTASTDGVSTIKFIADATNNTITNCTIKTGYYNSLTPTIGGGAILFSTGTTNGNDNNTISNCNLTSTAGGLANSIIYGLGSISTLAIANSGIIIRNNNIYDFFTRTGGSSTTSAGIYTNNGNKTWTIDGNRFYQTATRTFNNSDAQHSPIWIASAIATGGNEAMTITNNIIGYASSTQTGTYTLDGGAGSGGKFIAIYFTGRPFSGTVISTISNNTIQAVSFTNTGSSGTGTASPFAGIIMTFAATGTTTNTHNNIIGSQTATGNLTYTKVSNTTTTEVHGISRLGGNGLTWNAFGNQIGGITMGYGSSTSGAIVFHGIKCALAVSGATFTATSNIIGGSVANSIQINNSSSSSCRMVGFQSDNSANNGATAHNFTGNTVRNFTLSSTCNPSGTGTSAALAGILVNTTGIQTIKNNTVYNLSSAGTSSFNAWNFFGIHAGISATGSVIDGNFIYKLTSAHGSTNGGPIIAGIYITPVGTPAGTHTFSNNMISLPDAQAARVIPVGIYNAMVDIGATINIFHNSVYIGGSTSGSVQTTPVSSAAYYSTMNGATLGGLEKIQNNIFWNERTLGTSAVHVIINVAVNEARVTLNNNIYYRSASVTPVSFQARVATTPYTTFATWKSTGVNATTGLDAASIEGAPTFKAPTATTPDLHITYNAASWIGNTTGADLSAIVSTDFDGLTRSGFTAHDIGAAVWVVGATPDGTDPVITYTPIGNQTCGTQPITFNITGITDAGSGIRTSGLQAPIMYYKINSGSYNAVPLEWTSGTAYKVTFPAVPAFVAGDVISYYIMAQDGSWLTSNVQIGPNQTGAAGFTVNPPAVSTPPTTPSSFTISAPPAVNAGADKNTSPSASPTAIALTGATVASGNAKWAIVSLTPANGNPGTLSSYAETAAASIASITYTPPPNYSGTIVLRLISTTTAIGACTSSDEVSIISAASCNTGESIANGNWSETATWCGGSSPTSGNVTIAHDVTLNSTVSVANLTINSSKTLTLNANQQLTVTGTLTNNGTLTLKDGATLVQGTSGTSIDGSGTYNVEKQLTGNSSTWNTANNDGRFWYMGVPMSSVVRSGFGNYGASSNRVWSYNETTKQYTDITSDASLLSAGTGYVHRRSDNNVFTFTATGANGLYASDFSLTGMTRTAGASAGYHLISNPYMAYLDWEAVTSTNIEPTYFIRSFASGNINSLISCNRDNDQYTSTAGVTIDEYADVRYIAPLQAIWVRVTTAGTGSLNMTRSMLSHQSTNPGLKNTTVYPVLARVNLNNDQKYDQMLVFMNEFQTNTVDNFDSEKMFMSGEASIYTMASGKKLVMNGLKNNKKKISVPLYLELPTSKVYQLQLSEYIMEDGLILLEDKQEGTMQDFTIHDTYAFYANSGVLSNRFVLHFFMPDVTITAQGPSNSWVQDENEVNEGGGILVSSNGRGKVTIQQDIDPQAADGSQVLIRDASGRMVYEGQLEGTQTSLQLDAPSGVYFVEVQLNGQVEVKKIFVQQ